MAISRRTILGVMFVQCKAFPEYKMYTMLTVEKPLSHSQRRSGALLFRLLASFVYLISGNGLKEEDQRKIVHDNAACLYGLL